MANSLCIDCYGPCSRSANVWLHSTAYYDKDMLVCPERLLQEHIDIILIIGLILNFSWSIQPSLLPLYCHGHSGIISATDLINGVIICVCVTFLISVTKKKKKKPLSKSNLRKGGFTLAHGSRGHSPLWWRRHKDRHLGQLVTLPQQSGSRR